MSDGSDAEPYELVLTPPARRALTDELPEAVAGAVIDFLTNVLASRPLRVGKPLPAELAGVWSARRGTYRALYRVRVEPSREVVVLRIEHRRDARRPRRQAAQALGTEPNLRRSS